MLEQKQTVKGAEPSEVFKLGAVAPQIRGVSVLPMQFYICWRFGPTGLHGIPT